ncbi:hypothetical protein AVEN_268411-1 [Araneus ventricosus]|uniref:Uncharacterized protein n=1 Tax=Araneus ventricosus TaxID=182803 RepID=A0A4Y2DUU4_ARAVE|nr:hypothetical protein AVEN_268411-1 [Araneus ventricosus]
MRFPSRLIIGSGQRVTAHLLSALLVGYIQTIPRSSSSEPLWVCVRRGRFTAGFMALKPSSQTPYGFPVWFVVVGTREGETSQGSESNRRASQC